MLEFIIKELLFSVPLLYFVNYAVSYLFFNNIIVKNFSQLKLTNLSKDNFLKFKDKVIVNYLMENKNYNYQDAVLLVISSVKAVNPMVLSFIVGFFSVFKYASEQAVTPENSVLFMVSIITSSACYYMVIILNSMLLGKNYELGRYIPYEWRKTIISDFGNISYYEFWKKSNKEQSIIYEKAVVIAQKRLISYEKYKEEMIASNIWDSMPIEDKRQVENSIKDINNNIKTYKKGAEFSKVLD